jgi:protein-disulfide isomerase
MIRASLALACAASFGLAAAADAAPARRPAPPARRPAPPVRRPAAPAARDWSRTAVATAEGGFRIGNPSARVKLIEYGSLTCPHCAAFSQSGTPALVANYVRTGRVSYEFRTFVLNGIDVAASLVARCTPAPRFFPLIGTLYATQPQWIGRVGHLSQAQQDSLTALPEGQRLGRIADMAGLIQVAGRYGLAPARARQCLADKAGVQRLGKIIEAGRALGVGGTPTFFVNGVQVEGITWTEVEPALRRAGA